MKDLDALAPIVVVVATALCLLVEGLAPAVRHGPGRWTHAARNFGLWAVQIGINVALGAALVALSLGVTAHGFGLLPQFTMPLWLEVALGISLLDLTNYGRHRLSHRCTPLWRYHRIHHEDTRLDVTTALRAHPVESLVLVGVTFLQVAALGIRPETLLVYTPLLLGVSLLHHANVRLPAGVDQALRVVFVTPDMHRVHHSPDQPRTDSNYCVLFSVWDRIFATWTAPRREHDVLFGLTPVDTRARASQTSLEAARSA